MAQMNNNATIAPWYSQVTLKLYSLIKLQAATRGPLLQYHNTCAPRDVFVHAVFAQMPCPMTRL